MPPSVTRRHYDGETRAPSMKLWDGHSRTAVEWDGLHREPEMWTPNGNCLVYLYEKAQSNRGPSFRIDFDALIKARCYGFIERYIDKQGRKFDMPRTDADWNRLCPKRTVSLYVSAAPGSTRQEIAQQQLGIRNLLAWVTGLPLAGAHLGSEMVTLFRTMVTYRPDDADCVQDLLGYLAYIGYMDIIAQPHHALALLYAAEFLRHTDLYTRAFVHCVGMSDRTYSCTEYTKISPVSKKLIRAATRKLEEKLNSAIDDIGSFLDEELSESRLGLPAGVRAHLDTFRSTLFTFYTARFGYYPPRDFDSKTIQTMSEDFEALHDLLVDDGAGTPGMVGGNNGGGLCTLQIIRTFDSWNSFESRRHPLPLLPVAAEVRKARRLPWRGRGDKDKASSKLIAHAALIKASNWRESSFKNDLVRVYRDFEGRSLEPVSHKVDKLGNVSITDARKVRWILVYAMCQVLRSVSQRAPQVEGETAPYFLTASVADLPPWSTAHETTTDLASAAPASALPVMPASATADEAVWQPKFVGGLEIKPDIDYFALTHSIERQQREKLGRRQSMPVVQQVQAGEAVSPMTVSPPNTVSGNTLVRRSTIRDSIRRRLRPGTAASSLSPANPPPAKSAYHEIVVHGYGNGTSQVKLERRNTIGCDNPGSSWPTVVAPDNSRLPDLGDTTIPERDPAPTRARARVPPPVSTQSRSGSNRSSNASSISTADSSQPTSGPATPATLNSPEFEQNAIEPTIVRNSSHRSLTQRYPMRSMLGSLSRSSSRRRGSLASNSGVVTKDAPPMPTPPPAVAAREHATSLSRGPSFRRSLLPENWTLSGRATFENEINEEDEMRTLQAEADEWVAMQAFLDDDANASQVHKGAAPGWEQYNDLGGLTEVR